MLLSSGQVIKAVEQATGRKIYPATLKYWSDTGRVTRTAIHARCGMYDPEEVIAVAKVASANKPHSSMSKVVGMEVVK